MPDPISSTLPFGPDNPHPLSTRSTELVWEGKYDEYGRRRVRIPQPHRLMSTASHRAEDDDGR
jgi:hypothetical protein